MASVGDDVLGEVINFLPRRQVALTMELLSLRVRRIALCHVKAKHVVSELCIQPSNGQYGSVEEEQLLINGTLPVSSCCQVPSYILFKQVSIGCGVTLAHPSTWEFLQRNLSAFDGCVLAFGRMCDALRAQLDKLFALFAKCSCLRLLDSYYGPAWDRALLGNECWNSELFYQHEAVLNCNHLDVGFAHLDAIIDWILFGGAMSRPRRVTYRLYPFNYVSFILKCVVEWCERNQRDIQFTMHQYLTEGSGLCYDAVKRPRKECDLGIVNVGPSCPKNCFQGTLRRIFEDLPGQDISQHYEITNFKHEKCLFISP